MLEGDLTSSARNAWKPRSSATVWPLVAVVRAATGHR